MSGKRVSGSSHKKSIALVVSLALVLTAVLGVTIAYLTDSTPGVTNTFTPGQVSCKVNEEFNSEKTAKTSVTVANTSDTDVYIRVAVVANYVDGGVIQPGTPNLNLSLGNGWVKHGDYYYYTKTVAPYNEKEKNSDGITSNLLNASLTLPENTQVTILAEAIQATGEVNDETTTQYAWGVKISDLNKGGAA